MNGKGILIVSENKDLLISVTDCLRQMEFDVVTCTEGLQRNGFFKASSIKGILLDLEMSGIDGMSMLRYLRKIHPTVPIIALSIHKNVMGLVRAVEEGATDFMVKPIDPTQLREKCTLVFD
jgi:DNA-binding response OmpR family regulator